MSTENNPTENVCPDCGRKHGHISDDFPYNSLWDDLAHLALSAHISFLKHMATCSSIAEINMLARQHFVQLEESKDSVIQEWALKLPPEVLAQRVKDGVIDLPASQTGNDTPVQ